MEDLRTKYLVLIDKLLKSYNKVHDDITDIKEIITWETVKADTGFGAEDEYMSIPNTKIIVTVNSKPFGRGGMLGKGGVWGEIIGVLKTSV